MNAAVLGDRLTEVTQKPFLGCEMLSQYPQSPFQGFFGGLPGGMSSSSLRPKPSASICSVLTKVCLRLRNPGFRNRKPWVFINCHPPFPRPQRPSPPSTMERSAVASFGGRDRGFWGRGRDGGFWGRGRDGGFWGRVRVATYENPGFPNPGFRRVC